jgi:glycosyltransferase involved in cell wall biosynthesis
MNLREVDDSFRGGKPEISVIIPARNEEKSIGICLTGLRSSALPMDRLEVILVDNGSTDKTIEVARQVTGLPLKILTKPGVRIGGVRNAGAAVATGEYLAFIDADCVPPPDWLPTALRLIRQHGGIIGGPYGVPEQYSWVARVWADHEARKYNGPKSFVHGANMVVRRSDFLALSGFDAMLETNEDYEFCQRGLQAGLITRACSQMEIIHLGTAESLRKFFKRERWHGRHVVKVFLRNLPQIRNARAILFAIYMLCAVVATFVTALIAIRSGNFMPPALCLAAAAAAPLSLSALESLKHRHLHYLISLACLFLVYGVARAMCLTDFWTAAPGNRAHR